MNRGLLKKAVSAVMKEKVMGSKTPLISSFEILYRCNLLCKFCKIPMSKKYEMTTKQLTTALNEFSEAGMGIAIFTGGEPMLRNDLPKLINVAKSHDVFTHLVTNGTYLKKKIENIKQIDSLSVSIDGPKEILDKLRGPGVFDNTIEGLHIAKKSGIFTHIMSTITKDSVANGGYGIKQLLELSRKMDVKINFQPIYSDQYNMLDMSKVFPSKAEFVNVIELIEDYKRETGNVIASFAYLQLLKNANRIKDRIKWTCKGGRLFSFVFPDGKVAPCYFKEDMAVNGLEQGFINAFNSLPTCNENCCRRLCHGYREYNLVFDFNFQSLMNAFNQLILKNR